MSTTATEQTTKAEAARAALDALEERRAALLTNLDARAELVTALGETPDVEDRHRAAWTEAEILGRWIEAVTPEVERMETNAADAQHYAEERRRKAAQKAREERLAETVAAGVRFLEEQIPGSPVERSKLLEAAAEAGVSREELAAGARELGLRRYTRFRAGGDYIGPPAWPGAGWQRGELCRL